jgi:hypothetical protein
MTPGQPGAAARAAAAGSDGPNARHRRVVMLALVAALGAPGCAVSSYTTAETLPAGTARFWVAPQVLRLAVGGAPQAMPFIELGTRYGLSEDVELGLRLGAGAQADAKIALVRGEERGLRVAVAPSVGYIGNFAGTPTGADGDDLHFLGATAPVLITWRFGRALAATLAPRVAWLMQAVETESAATTHTLSAGASLGVEWRLLPNVRLVPEISAVVPWLRTLTGVGAVGGTGGQLAMQAGVAVVLGR